MAEIEAVVPAQNIESATPAVFEGKLPNSNTDIYKRRGHRYDIHIHDGEGEIAERNRQTEAQKPQTPIH